MTRRARVTFLCAIAAAFLWFALIATPGPAFAEDELAALRAEAHALRGEARLMESRERWRAILRENPGDKEALDAAAELAEILGDVKDAVALRLDQLRRNRDPWAAMTAAYLLRSRIGDVEGARRALTEGFRVALRISSVSRREAALADLAREEAAMSRDEARRDRIVALKQRQSRIVQVALIGWLLTAVLAWRISRRRGD
jgi:tetratricopeptide (TPR) repeat protein